MDGGWEPPPEWPQRGSITFARVRMSYGIGAPLVLNDLTFTVPGGSLVSGLKAVPPGTEGTSQGG